MNNELDERVSAAVSCPQMNQHAHGFMPLKPSQKQEWSSFAAISIALAIFLMTMIGPSCFAAALPRIVLLESFDVPVVLEHTRFFLDEMEKLGYQKGQIKVLKARGDPALANHLLRKEIDEKRPDVIVANATLASKAAYPIAKAKNIPMVFFVVSDPVGAGLVSKVNSPSNDIITGVVHSVPRDIKIQMVMKILKPLKPKDRPIRFGYIHTSYPSAVGDLKMLKEAANRRDDVEFVSYQIPYDEKHFNIDQTLRELSKGIEKIDSKIDYWWISQDPVGELSEYVRLVVSRSKHSVVCGTNVESVKDGALVYIAADTESDATEAASMVNSILRGEAVGTIPVHSPARIDFGVNLTTAMHMGVAIPSELLELAGSKVFR